MKPLGFRTLSCCHDLGSIYWWRRIKPGCFFFFSLSSWIKKTVKETFYLRVRLVKRHVHSFTANGIQMLNFHLPHPIFFFLSSSWLGLTCFSFWFRRHVQKPLPENNLTSFLFLKYFHNLSCQCAFFLNLYISTKEKKYICIWSYWHTKWHL